MGILTKSLILKSSPIPYGNRGFSFGSLGSIPSQTNEAYLRYYGQVSWVSACCHVIDNAIAENTWRLFQKKKDGSREEITGPHPFKDLWNKPNPWHTGHDFLEQHQLFQELTGETYWIKDKSGSSPELWLAKPLKMHPIPDGKKFISGYHYVDGDYSHDFNVDEVIPFILPNPLDPYSGLAPAAAVGLNIEILSYALQYNRNYFYWGADPGTVITYPKDANIDQETAKRIAEEWSANHRSYGRAFRTTVLSEGAVITPTKTGQRDMDYIATLKETRDAILGNWGIALSMLGGSEHVNRAVAEAEQYNLGKIVIHPRLVRIRERVNMMLLPDYGDDLEIDFDDPIPENREQRLGEAADGLKNGAITVNEYRAIMDMDPADNGDIYLRPYTVTAVLESEVIEATPPPQSVLPTENPPVESPTKSLFHSDTALEVHWNAFAKRTESYEKPMIRALNGLFSRTKAEAISNAAQSVDRKHKLIDRAKFEAGYHKAATPIVTHAFMDSMKQAEDLIAPVTPHKTKQAGKASEWIKARMAKIAGLIGQESESLMIDLLNRAYAEGWGADKTANAIRESFAFSQARSERIARTEMIAASNQGALEGYAENGIERKEWLAAMDERTRPAHADANGQVVGIDEDFSVGNDMGVGPGQMGSPENDCNCRCTVLPVVD